MFRDNDLLPAGDYAVALPPFRVSVRTPGKPLAIDPEIRVKAPNQTMESKLQHATYCVLDNLFVTVYEPG
jgi:hypothetical protein